MSISVTVAAVTSFQILFLLSFISKDSMSIIIRDNFWLIHCFTKLKDNNVIFSIAVKC